MAHFFIRRPVFAMVLSLLILLVGGLGIISLPVAQYPAITPPTVQVTAFYPGAGSKVVEETVATPLEQEINGAEDMLYMSSKSTSDGRCVVSATFKVGKNLNDAAVDIQNRVARAQAKLPQEVTRAGITVTKQSPDMLLVIALSSPDRSYDDLFLNNYALLNVQPELARVNGVGSVQIFTQKDYSMRVWLRPDKLAQLGLTADDVANALREQNIQAASGQVGAPPAKPGTEFQFSVTVKGRLVLVEEFENIIVRALPDGSMLRLRDVARVELGGKDYKSFGRLNTAPAALIGLYQLPTANALQTAEACRARLAELATFFPPGIQYSVNFDTTQFVSASIHEVLITLLEAFVLVIAVVFLFLGSWRATLIPMLAVPVSLIGTFAVFVPFGFTINTLTLFGMVLAIGIVVDDAIVVVEAVSHHLQKGLTPIRATELTMEEVTGPIIATSLVLCAVFVPVTFMGGITGRLYQQFAITLSISVLLSSLVALSLTPALCVLLLRPPRQTPNRLDAFFAGFNRWFDRITQHYTRLCSLLIRRGLITAVLLLAMYLGAFGLLRTLPTSFVPDEDQGYFFVVTSLPDGASQERTEAVLKKVEEHFRAVPEVRDIITIGGLNLFSSAYLPNAGTLIITLKPWDQRDKKSLRTVLRDGYAKLSQIPEAMIIPANPPPISGLGNAGGVVLQLQDRRGASPEELEAASNQFLTAAAQRPDLARSYTFYSTRVPQISLELDREKIKTLAVPLNTVFSSLQTYLGGLYVNDFTRFGRSFQVMLQAEPEFRMNPENIQDIFVRGGDGAMIPFGTISRLTTVRGSDLLPHYNGYRAAEINATPAPGFSSGQIITTLEQLAKSALPPGFSYEWTGMALQEKLAGGQQGIIFALALVFVFLVLAAQYESWSVPLAVVCGLPIGVFGALVGAWIWRLSNDVYVQIGLVMLLGLAAKNAILIVEFAKAGREQGKGIVEAAVEGAQLRFRPILMTSLAFVLGTLPLMLPSGAGAASRHSLGTAVFFGMSAATFVGVFFVPYLYVVVQSAAEKLGDKPTAAAENSGGAK